MIAAIKTEFNDIHWTKFIHIKEKRNLSFTDLQDFNTILLTKKLWHLIDKSGCLFSRVFKERYFRNTNSLDKTHISFIILWMEKHMLMYTSG